jgi:hypothetical protein
MLRMPIVVPVLLVAMAASLYAQAQPQPQAPAQGQRRGRGRGTSAPSPTPGRIHPPPGRIVPDDVRKDLTERLVPLAQAIEELSQSKDQKVLDLLPDVQMFYKGVHDALKYEEFFELREFADAKNAIEQGLQRARELKEGNPTWPTQIGLVPRAYVSKIDGSIQPYGLVVPKSYVPGGPQKYQLNIWLHGNHNRWSELAFIRKKQSWGERGDLVFMPADTIVLHPYGRFCNPYRVAGEMDVLEAIEAVKKQYSIDEDRVAMCGFSMGGMGCWEFATHYADRWVVTQPGGSEVDPAERGRFATLTTPWQKKLIHWYHSGDFALNLYNLPTVAYSGERDGSSNRGGNEMKAALAAVGIDLTHLIGPGTGHEFHPATRAEVERRLVNIAARGRDRAPREVKFATYTLKYNRMYWVTVDGLAEHWEPTRVDAEYSTKGSVTVATKNVTGLTLSFPAGWAPFDVTDTVTVSIDGQTLTGPRPLTDRSWTCALRRDGKEWRLGALEGFRKKHNLQGPIDDAFMDSFVFVKPTGKSPNPAVEKWATAELDQATVHWRQEFRGIPRVKDDKDITESDIASSHLVLWGDPSSNALLAKIAANLPIKWTDKEITVGDQKYAADKHVPILIYPNPLNPDRYVVINSGFTWRVAGGGRGGGAQLPQLPDWAIVDLETPATAWVPGKIVAADFFGEKWEITGAK